MSNSRNVNMKDFASSLSLTSLGELAEMVGDSEKARRFHADCGIDAVIVRPPFDAARLMELQLIRFMP